MKYSVVISIVTALLVTVGIAKAEGDSEPRYVVPTFGYSAVVPADWSIYMEMESDTMAIVSFGLPEVWSELEKQNIENAISIVAYRRDDIHSAQDVIDFEAKRKASIIVSNVDAGLDAEPARLIITRIKGFEYKTLAAYRYRNFIGYEISFTATEGTYDTNLQRFLTFIKKVRFFAPDPNGATVYPSRLQEASLLYRTNPKALDTVISLLREELDADSTNFRAAQLLTLALFDGGRYEETVAMADWANKLNTKGLNPVMNLYKGKALYEMGRYQEVEFFLGGLWALYQGDRQLSNAYDELMAKTSAKLKSDVDSATVQPQPK